MAYYKSDALPVTMSRQEEIYAFAKAQARQAIRRGSPTGLTALGLAYYLKFKSEKSDV